MGSRSGSCGLWVWFEWWGLCRCDVDGVCRVKSIQRSLEASRCWLLSVVSVSVWDSVGRCGVERRVRLLEPTGGSSGLLFGCCRSLWRMRLFVEVSVSVSPRGRPDSDVVSLLSFI